MVSVFPPVGTVPANDTVPDTGATTSVPPGAPMSMPRWSPAPYGLEPKLNARRTGPCTGQAQPLAADGAARATAAAVPQTTSVPPRDHIRCQFCKLQQRYQVATFVVKSDYSEFL
jgi:hypothetical protein